MLYFGCHLETREEVVGAIFVSIYFGLAGQWLKLTFLPPSRFTVAEVYHSSRDSAAVP